MTIVEFTSPLSVEECRDRLGSAMNLTVVGRKPVIGHVSGTSFQARRRKGFKQSFETRLLGEIAAYERRSHIRCVFTNSKTAIAVVMTLLGVLVCMFGGMALAAIVVELFRAVGFSSEALTTPAFLLALLVCGYLLVLLQRWISQNERRFLLEFVCVTLHATRLESPPAS